MLVHINSYPGVGKLTIGRILAEQIAGKLLDNHFNLQYRVRPDRISNARVL